MLHLSLLGPFRAVLDGAPVTGFPTDKVRALLAFLALEAERPHRRDTLAALLWPEWPNEEARRNLRHALHRLRATLDAHDPTLSARLLAVSRESVQLHAAALHLDVAEFEEVVGAVAQHGHRALAECDGCRARLAEVLAGYEGELLAGFNLPDAEPFEEWLLLRREALHYRALAALGALGDAHEARGEWEATLRYAQRQLALEPWREEAHRQAMRALAAAGQRAEALAQWERGRATLAAELGVEPSAETAALAQALREGTWEPNPARRPTPALHGFPAAPTPFVGRAAEQAMVAARLNDPACRLLTLIGAGGMGKTRLSVEVARGLAETGAFPDGCFFVPLAPVASVEGLIPALGGVLGVEFHGRGDPRTQVLDALRARRALLVLDNFEHLLDGAELVAALLDAAPEVKVLATSREALRVRAEWQLPVEGLSVAPDPTGAASEAAQLFEGALARVRGGGPPADPATLARICTLTEGMPLALEIAATWARLYDLDEIAARIASELDFLVTPLRDVPDRHRSVRAVFEHSWQLLNPAERRTLAQAAYFQGGFTLEAALTVAVASVAEVASLLDKSLLRRTATGRYEMHELLRQFAAEKLGELETGAGTTLQERHARFFLGRAAQREAELYAEHPARTVAEMEQERDNLHRAWEWAVQAGEAGIVQDATEALMTFWEVTGRWHEGVASFGRAAAQWAGVLELASARAHLLACEATLLCYLGQYAPATEAAATAQVLAEAAANDVARGRAVATQGLLHRLQGRYEEALHALLLARACQEATGQRALLTHTLNGIASVHWCRGDFAAAQQGYAEGLRLAEALGYGRGIAMHLTGHGVVHWATGRYDEALGYYRRALARHEALGYERGMVNCLGNIALVHKDKGEWAAATDFCEQAATRAAALHDHDSAAIWSATLGHLLHRQGKHGPARAHLDAAIASQRTLHAAFDLIESLRWKAELLWDEGEPQAACTLAEEAEALAAATGRTEERLRSAALAARCAHAGGDPGAPTRLRALLDEAPNDPLRALLHWELWQVTGATEPRTQAQALYQQLYARIPNARYRERLAALETAR